MFSSSLVGFSEVDQNFRQVFLDELECLIYGLVGFDKLLPQVHEDGETIVFGSYQYLVMMGFKQIDNFHEIALPHQGQSLQNVLIGLLLEKCGICNQLPNDLDYQLFPGDAVRVNNRRVVEINTIADSNEDL